MTGQKSKMEGEVYPPSPDLAAASHIPNWEARLAEADADYLGFWAARAAELEWQAPWVKVLDDSRPPFFRWFTDARTNIVHNALDRHVRTWRRNKLALIWEGEPGDERSYSYDALHREVAQFSEVLRGLGARKGDRITIYMGRLPEIVIAMLACARIGAVHSVVYGGFSVEALHGRIDDSQSRLLITADGGWLNGKIVRLKDIADEALRRCPSIEHVIVVRRTGHEILMQPGRDLWYHDLLSPARAPSVRSQTEILDSEDPLYILYTSGTTGKPKAIVHTHGGYQVGTHTSLKYVFDLREEDRWWCAADPGWVTGHSYIVYGPLLNGATSFMYEGAPTYPEPDRWWRLIEKYAITILYTAPTAIRGLMRLGDSWPARHDLSSLRLLGSVGEPINPEAWKWYYRAIGRERCPIMDTWWQTETGMFMITPVPSAPLKPGSATKPFFGQQAEVVGEDGLPVPDGQEGYLVLKRPWPAMLRTLYRDDDRYVEQYWSRFPGKYLTGDSAKRDVDGYFWIIGRVDDVIKVSGYRLGTAEIESALVSHPSVAEAAVIGLPDDLKGHVIHAFCILRAGHAGSPQLAEELKAHVGHEIGPIARPAEIEFPDKLPKTRSGKIMRRVLKARAQGLAEGDISTLEE
jgi:acetyl-CoA synthetase